MKRILLIVLMTLPLLVGQVAVRENPATVAWDAVEPMGGDEISYEVFVAPLGNYGSAESVGQTELLEMEIEVESEGDWVIGVRTVRTILVSGEVLYSEINWSDANGLATPSPFFLRFYQAPDAPVNFRIK